MNDQARRGRKTIIAIIAVYFLLEFPLLAFEMAVTGRSPELPAFLRLGLSALLAVYLYLGRDWARWVWGILLLLGILTGLALGTSSLRPAGAHPVILLFSCAGLIYFLGSAIFLFLSPDIREYMSYQRSRSATTHPSP